MPTTPRSAGAACCCCSCGWARRGSPRLSWRCCGPSPGTARSTPSSSRKARRSPVPRCRARRRPRRRGPPRRRRLPVDQCSASTDGHPVRSAPVADLHRPHRVGPAVPASRQHQAGHAADPDVERKPLVCPQRSGGPAATTGSGGNGTKRGRRARRGRQLGRRAERRAGRRAAPRAAPRVRPGSPRSGGNSISSSVPELGVPASAPLRPGGRKTFQKCHELPTSLLLPGERPDRDREHRKEPAMSTTYAEPTATFAFSPTCRRARSSRSHPSTPPPTTPRVRTTRRPWPGR